MSDSTSGLGDITLYPFMLGWTNSTDMKYDVRLGVYAPTGSYEKGQLANAGRNYWTFEPSVSFSWLSTKIGTEVTALHRISISTPRTRPPIIKAALPGIWTARWRSICRCSAVLPAWARKDLSMSKSAPDSGSGATLGGFEGQTIGVGPVVSYAHKIGKVDFAGEVKWLPEVDVQKRLQGDYVWVKLGIVF